MLEVVDLFCGAGGLSLGLRQSGLCIRAAFDSGAACIATYNKNFRGVKAIVADIRSLKASDILKHVASRDNLVLAGCPPCQLFSQLHRRKKSVGAEFNSYLRLIWSIRPAYIVFENVPRIVDRPDAWDALQHRLDRCGYHVAYKVVTSDQLGVPQRRIRMVLLAAKTPIQIPSIVPTAPRTVRETIEHLPEADGTIPNHVTMALSAKNLKRIQSTMHDGGRSKLSNVPFDDSYARMAWDKPAPTITTRCVSFSNGRFGHPVFDRAITVREAAYLQGFPSEFIFSGGVWETARQVGNAVPPPLAKWLGSLIGRHYQVG